MTGHLPRIAVAGAGAGGCSTAIRLPEKRAGATTPMELPLIDPAPGDAPGVAYGTPDRRHRHRVPADTAAEPDRPRPARRRPPRWSTMDHRRRAREISGRPAFAEIRDQADRIATALLNTVDTRPRREIRGMR